ncbi:hypothetical protein ACFTAO_35045 [Paenibacillus rhizoplanae]
MISSATSAKNEVLTSLISQMQSLGGVLKIGRVLDAVDSNLESDIENAQIKSLIATYWDISKENVEYVPVTGTWRSPYVYINDKELDAAKKPPGPDIRCFSCRGLRPALSKLFGYNLQIECKFRPVL